MFHCIVNSSIEKLRISFSFFFLTTWPCVLHGTINTLMKISADLYSHKAALLLTIGMQFTVLRNHMSHYFSIKIYSKC